MQNAWVVTEINNAQSIPCIVQYVSVVEIILGKGNYAKYDTNVKISFSSTNPSPPPPPPPLESFTPEDLEGSPP